MDLRIVDGGTPLPEAAALERVRAMLAAGEDIKPTTLGQEWGWSRQTQRSTLARWQRDGLIPALKAAKPSAKKAAKRAVHSVPRPAPLVAAPPLAPEAPVAPAAAVEAAPAVVPVAAPPAPTAKASVPWTRLLTGAAVLATAAVLGCVGLVLNAQYSLTLAAHGSGSGMLMATIAVCFDVLTVLMPATAEGLTGAGRRRDRLIASVIYFVALAMTTIAASSFVATNVGDSRLERSDVTEQRQRVDARLAELTARRSVITERRTVGQIDAALSAAQQDSYVLAVRRRTGGCVDVTLPASATACRVVTELRQAKASAEGRDKLDAQIATAEAEKARLLAIASADPGAEWLGAVLRISPALIANLRIAGLALAPPLSGWLLKFAFLLLGFRRAPGAALL
jgi:hypothetical protein